MNQDSNFYKQQFHFAHDFSNVERILFDLASKFLRRKICLISLFPEDEDEVFEPPMSTKFRTTYYLLGCNQAMLKNFYVSIFKDAERELTHQKPLGRRSLRAKIQTTLQQWDQN